MKYISTDALGDALENLKERKIVSYAELVSEIAAIPAADVRTVARAAWRGIGKTGRIFVCSACDNTFPYKTRYCPNCGAMMEVRE